MKSEPELRIHLFGPLQIMRRGRALTLPPSRAARSLLAWLLLRPGKQHARAALLGVFWPDMPEAAARRALTQALWQIRRIVPDLVQADRAAIAIAPDTAVFVDALAFRELLRPCQPPEIAPERLRQAVELAARGELLEGFYDDWIFPEREQLREQYLNALEQLAQSEKQDGRYQQALAAVSQINRTDPLRESAWQERMRLHAALGQPETALQQYERYRRILAEELDARPQPETDALAQAIARQTGQTAAPFVPAPDAPAGAPAFTAATLPLVGRAAERDALLRQITAVPHRQGGIIFISGEAGAGKSRLLQEAAEAAAWRGVQPAWGYAQDQAAAPPFGPLIQALSAALSPLRIQQIHRLLPELWLAAAAPLLPEITAVLPNLAPPPALPPDQEPLRQLEALARLTLALGEIAPQLIILEDLHWADRRTLDALAYLGRRLTGSRTLLLGSFRGEDAQENEDVWRGLQTIEAAGLRLHLRLPPLAADSVAELVRQGLNLPQIAPRFSQRLYRQCGGNPFHVLETLRALRDNGLLYRDEQGGWHTPYDQATDDYAELPIPAASEQVIRQRLERLSPAARLTAQTAALIGREVDFLLLETAVPLETRDTLAALGALAQRQFLQETAVGYQFSHDQIRHTLLADLPPDLARELHGRIAAALEQYQPGQTEQLAWHYAAAENAAKAIQYSQAAAAQARQNHALQTALDHLNQAIRFRPPDDLLYELVAQREELHNALARRESQADDLAQMDKLARTPPRQIETRLRRARWHMEQSRFDAARREAAAAKEIAEQIGDTAAIGQAEMALYDAVYTQSGDIAAARAHLERARARFRAAGDDRAEADTWVAEARLLRGGSDYQQASAILQDALRQREAAGDLPAQEYIHWQLGTIGMERGNVEQADEHFRRALELAQTIGHRYREAVIHVNWGNLLWMQGKFPRTLEHYREALHILAETGQRRAEAQILANLASMQCALLGDYETSAANANKSLAYYREVGDEVGIG
ncbi:MAG TPA: tetratricopeptide repeat protein, partial [Anaerolineae bacterium]|nr:tetratricopeptide repeat protein [Anaerolineae bacterium]